MTQPLMPKATAVWLIENTALTFEQVAEFISKLKAPEESVFLLTHIGGWVNPDIEKISRLCQEMGVSLVEDCAPRTIAPNICRVFSDGV